MAMTLNNLATLHYAKNEMAIALVEYQEALQMRRELAVENPRSFLLCETQTISCACDSLRQAHNQFSRRHLSGIISYMVSVAQLEHHNCPQMSSVLIDDTL